jgi:hypothetical protein
MKSSRQQDLQKPSNMLNHSNLRIHRILKINDIFRFVRSLELSIFRRSEVSIEDSPRTISMRSKQISILPFHLYHQYGKFLSADGKEDLRLAQNQRVSELFRLGINSSTHAESGNVFFLRLDTGRGSGEKLD